VKLKHFERR